MAEKRWNPEEIGKYGSPLSFSGIVQPLYITRSIDARSQSIAKRDW